MKKFYSVGMMPKDEANKYVGFNYVGVLRVILKKDEEIHYPKCLFFGNIDDANMAFPSIRNRGCLAQIFPEDVLP